MENTKNCTKCSQLKPLEDFYFRKQTGVYKSACKECEKKDRAIYLAANLAKVVESRARYAASPRGQAKSRATRHARFSQPHYHLQKRAYAAVVRGTKAGMPCASREALYEYLVVQLTDTCPCCKIPYEYVLGQGRNPRTSRAPSIDRIDNTRSYTLDNVVLVCSRCNVLRSDATLDDLRNLVTYVESFSKPFLKLVHNK